MSIASRDLSPVQAVSPQDFWPSPSSVKSLDARIVPDLKHLAALPYLYFSTTYSANPSTAMSLQPHHPSTSSWIYMQQSKCQSMHIYRQITQVETDSFWCLVTLIAQCFVWHIIKSFPKLQNQYSHMNCTRQQTEQWSTEAVCFDQFLFSFKSLTNRVSIGTFCSGNHSAAVKAAAAQSTVHAPFWICESQDGQMI